MMFERFQSLTRFSHDWTITEKIDGSNGQILIANIDDPTINHGKSIARVGDLFVFAGSRNRMLGLGKEDNMGFAGWVASNAESLVPVLGEGRHYGEWCGLGIQRGYGLKRKMFALFNTRRWTDTDLPDDVTVVPVLYQGYADNPGSVAKEAMENMFLNGSAFAPGFMNPEGVVMRHGPSGTVFKKTYDYDEQGKWAENQARKENT